MKNRLLKLSMYCCALSTALMVAEPRRAEAVTFDFAAIGAANEHGTTVFNQSGGGLSFAVTTYDLTTNNPYYVYLDGPSGGGEGGLGSCKSLYPSGECDETNSLDDQIGFNEVVKIVFDQPVTLSNFDFQNGNHEDIYTGAFGVLVDQTPVNSASFNLVTAAPSWGGPIGGTIFYFVSNATIDNVNNNDLTRTFYISRFDAIAGVVPGSVVPEPMTLSLLGIGALAAMRKNKKLNC